MSSIMDSIFELVGYNRSTPGASMDNQQSFLLNGSSVNIVSRCQTELCEIIRHKFQCEATFEGVDFQGDSNVFKKKKAPDTPGKRFEVTLPSGTRVSVWKGDLTESKVDAIVNAANSKLQHGGGLAAAISKVGGSKIKNDSEAYIRTRGSLPTGKAILCNAGNLPCKKLIHAVGPHMPYKPNATEVSQARRQLEETIRGILDIVVEHQLTSVAMPAISSGLFNYPLADCAETIVNTVKLYFQSSPRNSVEVLLMNNDEPTVAAITRACHQIMGSQSSASYNQAAFSNTRGAANISPDIVQMGNVLVTLKRDKIEEQQTDVIVNTVGQTRHLSNGMISAALLKKAGYDMQQELTKAPKKGCIVVTKPYRLMCKQVFHTFCVEKSRRDGEKILYDSVYECLWMAVTSHHKSVAFPAIGTGALGFSGEEVASIMCKAVAQFAPNCKARLEVHFVIFPSDDRTFEAFQDELRSLKSKEPRLNVPLALESNVDSPRKKAGPPHISLMGSTVESINEARRWLTGLLLKSSDEISIQNNFIQHLSDRQYQQLTRLTGDGVSVEEFLSKGHACINVSSHSREDGVLAALQVETMLREVQEAFVRGEEAEMKLITGSDASFERKIVDPSSQEFMSAVRPFRQVPLSPIKVERVENAALKMLFDFKKQQLKCASSRPMYQCIPAQFCDLVGRVGFHAEVAPPEAPNFGEGIYFTATVEKAREVWRANQEEHLYFVEAEVLEGHSTRGKPGLILPPVMENDPGVFNSVHGGPEVSVIFSGYQALPRYIITCGK